MKTTKKHRTTKKKFVLITVAVLILVLITSGAAFLLYSQQPAQNATDTSERPGTSSKQSKNTSTDPGSKEGSTNTDTPEPPAASEDGNKTVVQMTISVTISNNTIYIRGGIDNAVLSDGTCYAQLTNSSGETKRINTTLLQNPTTTDCKTISLSSSDLSAGVWSIKLYYLSDTVEGVSNENSIEIK